MWKKLCFLRIALSVAVSAVIFYVCSPQPPDLTPYVADTPWAVEGKVVLASDPEQEPDERPKFVKMIPPEYPDAARESGIEGTVFLRLLVGEDGRVKDIEVTGSVPELDEAALASARTAIFIPAMHGGSPVAVWLVWALEFIIHN